MDRNPLSGSGQLRHAGIRAPMCGAPPRWVAGEERVLAKIPNLAWPSCLEASAMRLTEPV